MVRVPVRPGMRSIGGPPTKEVWSGPINHTVDPGGSKLTGGKKIYNELLGADTARVIVQDVEAKGQRENTWHRSAYPQEFPPEEGAPAAGKTRPRQSVSLSAPVSEAKASNCWERPDFPAGKPRFAYGDRHDLPGPGFTHDRVIGYDEPGKPCSYETSQSRDARKLYKAVMRKSREPSMGKHHPKPQAEPWDEAVAMKMKARNQEDEWRRCLKKRSRAPSEATRSKVTSCSMVTAGLRKDDEDGRKHGNGSMPYGKMNVPLFPGDELTPIQESARSVASQSQVPDEEDYMSAIGMCRTDRLSRLLRVNGERP